MRSPAPVASTHTDTAPQTITYNQNYAPDLQAKIFNMLVNKAVQLALLAAVVLLDSTIDAAAIKICGRQLSIIMSKMCHSYNSPSWDAPTVEQPSALARRKREIGIADECCILGCTFELLRQYCAISAYSESPLEAHIISDRSAELGASEPKEATPVEPVAVPAGLVRSAMHRAAPVVGTVSPLITWGRTLNTDPSASHHNYAYVVYT